MIRLPLDSNGTAKWEKDSQIQVAYEDPYLAVLSYRIKTIIALRRKWNKLQARLWGHLAGRSSVETYFLTVIVFFNVFLPLIFAEMVAFPAFLALILPLELTVSTEGLEDFQVMPFKIFASVLFVPPIIPGYAVLQYTVIVLDCFTFMEEGPLRDICVTFDLPTSMVCT